LTVNYCEACETKVCTLCKQEKPRNGFHKDARLSTGLKSECKSCARAKRAESLSRDRDSLTQARLKQLLSYDAASGVFTRVAHVANQPAGVEATSLHPSGYVYIAVDGRGYRAHRLAWLYVYGGWPIAAIDHINRDRADNRLANLRLATASQNTQNSSRPNQSGLRGVSGNHGKWAARITIHQKTMSLGTYATKEEAHEAYRAAASRVHTHNPHAHGGQR
jgi:hypothetical protein